MRKYLALSLLLFVVTSLFLLSMAASSTEPDIPSDAETTSPSEFVTIEVFHHDPDGQTETDCENADIESNPYALFGIKDLVLDEDSEIPLFVTISLQGWPDSAEYMAAAEWRVFQDGYDKDGSILWGMSDQTTRLEPVFEAYGAYTQEMAEKVAEIAAKYGLSLFEMPMHFYQSNEHLFQAANTGDFLGSAHGVSGYIFGSGTFQFDGVASIDGIAINYQFRNSQKGTFDNVFSSFYDIDDYEEKLYETICGTTVVIAIGPVHSMIIADLRNSFVCISIPFSEASAQTLEAFADSINFTALESRT